MLFHTAGFLIIFLPMVLVFMRILPTGISRTACLLFFSYLFYSGKEPGFIFILLISSVVDFSISLALYNRAENKKIRKLLLSMSIIINLGILSYYKYGSMILSDFIQLTDYFDIPIQVPDASFYKTFTLPAGISFYTFQSMSYTIDVYRRKIKPEKNILSFCNYVAYLPQLIAGPIERFSELSPQLHNLSIKKSNCHLSAGLDRLALGIIQKLFIADSASFIVDTLIKYSGNSYTFLSAWGLAIAFGIQIFYDFSAYTHMAIGISLMLGVKLSENFLSPYKASNIQDFWRSWHISLSSWFRDYLYIPLGGSRQSMLNTFRNLMITFMLCGLWHGAGWNFVAWGIAHGLLIAGYHIIAQSYSLEKIPRACGIIVTFLLVHIIWVLFRISNLSTIFIIWKAMLGFNGWSLGHLSMADFLFILIITIITQLVPNSKQRWPGSSGWKESVALWLFAIVGVFSSPQINQFIYFQF